MHGAFHSPPWQKTMVEMTCIWKLLIISGNGYENLVSTFSSQKAVLATANTFKYSMLCCFQQKMLWSTEMNISFIAALKNVFSKLLWFSSCMLVLAWHFTHFFYSHVCNHIKSNNRNGKNLEKVFRVFQSWGPAMPFNTLSAESPS